MKEIIQPDPRVGNKWEGRLITLEGFANMTEAQRILLLHSLDIQDHAEQGLDVASNVAITKNDLGQALCIQGEERTKTVLEHGGMSSEQARSAVEQRQNRYAQNLVAVTDSLDAVHFLEEGNFPKRIPAQFQGREDVVSMSEYQKCESYDDLVRFIDGNMQSIPFVVILALRSTVAHKDDAIFDRRQAVVLGKEGETHIMWRKVGPKFPFVVGTLRDFYNQFLSSFDKSTATLFYSFRPLRAKEVYTLS